MTQQTPPLLEPDFWERQFAQGHTPWNRGTSSPQLLHWLDTDELRPCSIVVPGCGHGWEVATLASRGFEVIGIDYTEAAVHAAKDHLAKENLPAQIINADVLTYQPETGFDAVYEQTCLCAISPDLWMRYADQLYQWLRPEGDLFLLLMQVDRESAKKGIVQGPPFHCDINAMHALFNSSRWSWPNEAPTVIHHPYGWHELAVHLKRKSSAS